MLNLVLMPFDLEMRKWINSNVLSGLFHCRRQQSLSVADHILSFMKPYFNLILTYFKDLTIYFFHTPFVNRPWFPMPSSRDAPSLEIRFMNDKTFEIDDLYIKGESCFTTFREISHINYNTHNEIHYCSSRLFCWNR